MTNRVREIRTGKGIKQVDLAISAGLEPSLLNIVEKGKNCTQQTKERISAALGVPVKKLFPE